MKRQTRYMAGYFIFLVFLAGFIAPAKPVHAQDVFNFKERISRCSEITERVERIICYDQVAEDMGYIPPERVDREEEIIETYGFWRVAKKRNAAGEEIIYLKNDSVEYVASKSGMRRKPTLVIKCKSGQTDLYIDWKASLIPRTYNIKSQLITFQFGAGESYSEPWEISTDKQAIFNTDPVKFIKEMRSHDKVIFQIAPYHDIAQTIVHDISGLDTVLKLLVKLCYD